MAEMTIEQQRALAKARARLRLQQQQQAPAQGAAMPEQAGSSVIPPADYNGYADQLGDVFKSAGSGIARGTANLFGMPGTVTDLIREKANQGMEALGFPAMDPEIMRMTGAASPFSGEALQRSMSSLTGGATDYEPKTRAGRYAAIEGEFLPAAAAMPTAGGSLANLGTMAQFGVLPAIASEYAGEKTKGTPYESVARTGAAMAAPAAATLAMKAVAPLTGSRAKIPTTEEIERLKNAAYKDAEAAGVAFTPEAIKRLNDDITAKLADFGYAPENQPGVVAALRNIRNLQGQNVTLKGLDTIRKTAQGGFIPGNKANNAAVSKLIDAIDDAIDNPRPGEVLMGAAGEGAEAIKRARSYAAREAKARRVNYERDRAAAQTASTYAGGNIENATRQRIRRIYEEGLKNKSGRPRGYSADEFEALKKVVFGRTGQGAARLMGRMSPTGGGLAMFGHIAASAINPKMALLTGGSMTAKAIADAMSKGNVENLRNTILAGSKAATKAPPNAFQRAVSQMRISDPRAAALLLSLIGQRQEGGGGW